MKESLKNYLNRCRCCLESFTDDENISPITDFFTIQFSAFTCLELQSDELLSNHICEYCHSELLRFSVFKKDLIEKQLKLYKLLAQHKQTINEINSNNNEEIMSNYSSSDDNALDEQEYEIDQMGSISENYSESCEDSESGSNFEISTEDDVSIEELRKKMETPTIMVPRSITERQLICDYCDLRFLAKQGLVRHLKTHILNVECEFKCKYCDFTSSNHHHYYAHLNQFHADKKTQTSYSNGKNDKPEAKSSDQKSNLIKTPKYRCFCGYAFYLKKSFNSHKSRRHGSIKKCNFGCNLKFNSVGGWIRHIRETHPIHEEDCLKMIEASKSNTWYTVIKESDLKNEDLVCQKCQFIGSDKAEMIYHYQMNHNKTERKHECPKCFKYFSSASAMRLHIRTVHQEIRRFVCRVCKMPFKQVGHLKDHARKKHNKDYKHYSCPECNANFEYSSEVKRHVLVYHTNSAKKIDKKINKCVCKKIFQYPSRLISHQKSCKVYATYLKARSGKSICGTCNKSFVMYKSLLRHQRTFGHT